MTDPWTYTADVVRWLDANPPKQGDPVTLRLLKIAEEYGEAAQAYFGVTAQNPRKGATHTPADVADELCDVILAAMVALHDHVPDPQDFFQAFVRSHAQRQAALTERSES
ncbi:MazG-like family protein [Streptomyces sp. NPDC046925]|uniref:MazG-like family protein n=1 Tax=Streptomyces sp. NPDC046925 TaxID=3155375 RepID=UPI0033F40E98